MSAEYAAIGTLSTMENTETARRDGLTLRFRRKENYMCELGMVMLNNSRRCILGCTERKFIPSC